MGSRFVRYYEICGTFDSVGAMISNDDWGFKTQTMLSVGDMRINIPMAQANRGDYPRGRQTCHLALVRQSRRGNG